MHVRSVHIEKYGTEPDWNYKYESEWVGMSKIVGMIECVGMRAESKWICDMEYRKGPYCQKLYFRLNVHFCKI